MSLPEAMREALALACQGRGQVEPNPRVGAVALRGDEVVGRGFHGTYGGDHAEVAALRDAADRGAQPDTLVVTLEPCTSDPGELGKKTPPCTDAILQAGVRRVVFGAADPDPRHHGRAAAVLGGQGVEVLPGVLAEECEAINRPFLRWLQLDVPWVIAKWAMSLDGKTATFSGDSRWISCDESRARVHEVRGRVDGVMVGLQTAVIDDPLLTVRHVTGEDPIRVVIDPLAELPRTSKLVQTAGETPTWVLIGGDAEADKVQALEDEGVVVVRTPAAAADGDNVDRGLDLAAGLRELRSRGLRRVLMEGGGGLAAKLFAAGLIHQAMVFVAPKVIGGVGAKTPVAGAGVDLVRDAWRFDEVVHETIGDDLVVHGFAT